LLQIAFWLATFGAIAAIAIGVAGVSDRNEVRKWCYAISSSSHFLANCYVLAVAGSALASAA
jgi:hypothetical protein